jgi:hypothetical protein
MPRPPLQAAGALADDAQLLRRIRSDQIVDDKNMGQRRPSSAAFKDPELSVDAEPVLVSQGLDWKFSLTGFTGYSLAKFSAGQARSKQLVVENKPVVGNPAHTVVAGKKTQGIANYLVASCTWVHLEP